MAVGVDNDLGGPDNISTQQLAIIDLAAKQKFYLDSVDGYLLELDTLITGPKKAPALKPVVAQRQQLADGLARYLTQLGLERRHKVKTVGEILSHDDSKPLTTSHGIRARQWPALTWNYVTVPR